MILLDASPLIALVAGEPGEPAVARLLANDEVVIPAPNLAEAVDYLTRRRGLPDAALRAALEPLLAVSIKVLSTTSEQAWRAGLLRARHYHRAHRPVSIPDCLLLACADADDTIVTSDRPLIAAARQEGIAVERVLDSRGELPQ